MAFFSRKTDSDSQSKISKELTIVNRLGLHARPSAMFVKTAGKFRAEVWVEKDGERINGKSIMGLMMLAAGQGSKLRVTCEGADADKALIEIEAIIVRKFDED
ncbi:MAG: phosphocarrier protein HPr [Chthoniobacter sp.]|jgi:phosphocarrier protein|nr:phosphocarrier protein HPr [Chthoniobacter sp.]